MQIEVGRIISTYGDALAYQPLSKLDYDQSNPFFKDHMDAKLEKTEGMIQLFVTT